MSLYRTQIRVPKDELDFLKNESVNISHVARKAIHDKCIKLGKTESRKEQTVIPLDQTNEVQSD